MASLQMHFGTLSTPNGGRFHVFPNPNQMTPIP